MQSECMQSECMQSECTICLLNYTEETKKRSNAIIYSIKNVWINGYRQIISRALCVGLK